MYYGLSSFTKSHTHNMPNPFFVGARVEEISTMIFNVRGMRNKRKRLSLFKTLRQEKVDIIALQETYLTGIDCISVEREWGGKVVLAPGSNKSKGLIFLFSRKMADCFKIETVYFDSRILLIYLVGHDEDRILLGNIYAPCISKDKAAFMTHFNKKVNEYTHNFTSHVICMGDFNLVLRNHLDIISGECHSVDLVKNFNDNITNLDLFDSYRLKYKTSKMHSWSRSNPPVARRLDYIFVNEDFIPFVKSSEIKSIGFSDHRAVITSFGFSSFKRGPSVFKINTSLFKDPSYIDIIKKGINEILENKSLDPHLRWEFIKSEVREISQEYGRFCSFKRKRELENITQNLNILDQRLAVEDDKAISRYQSLRVNGRLGEWKKRGAHR